MAQTVGFCKQQVKNKLYRQFGFANYLVSLKNKYIILCSLVIMSSWTQVYVTGISKGVVIPTNEEIEANLVKKYNLSDDSILWAGEGTTLIKRDAQGACRGFAFLSFYSLESANEVIERINADVILKAELSQPKEKKKKVDSDDKGLHDLRLRRQRKNPIRKHPVITTSNGKRTNLGNKTK